MSWAFNYVFVAYVLIPKCYMNYKSSFEFVKSQSEKIDEISYKFDPRFSLEKNLPKLFHSAGIDFVSEEGGADVETDRADLRDSATISPTVWEDENSGMGTLCHLLIGNIKVPTGVKSGGAEIDENSGKNPILCYNSRPFYGGLDGGTSVCVSGSPAESGVFDEIEKALEVSRETGRPVTRTLGGIKCLISPAPGGGRVHYRCKVEFGGVVVYLHQNPCKTIPAAKITYSWDVCDRYDLEEIQEMVILWLKRIGVEREFEWITRLDIQVTAAMDLDPFYRKTISADYRCRITKPHFHADGEFPEGVFFGSHSTPIFARLYDKWREAFGNSEEKCVNLMERFDAGGYDVMRNPVTRFEFEAHRQFLSTLGINTFQDLKANGRGYVAYLCNWLRFVDKKNGKHTEREKTLPEWEEVAEMFRLLFSDDCPDLHRKERQNGGSMTAQQYQRTKATVETLLAKMLLHRVKRNHSEPPREFREMLQEIFHNIPGKFGPIYQEYMVKSPDSLLEDLRKTEN